MLFTKFLKLQVQMHKYIQKCATFAHARSGVPLSLAGMVISVFVVATFMYNYEDVDKYTADLPLTRSRSPDLRLLQEAAHHKVNSRQRQARSSSNNKRRRRWRPAAAARGSNTAVTLFMATPRPPSWSSGGICGGTREEGMPEGTATTCGKRIQRRRAEEGDGGGAPEGTATPRGTRRRRRRSVGAGDGGAARDGTAAACGSK